LLFAAIEDSTKIQKLLQPASLGLEQASASDWFLKLSEMTQSSLYGRIGCDNLLSIVGTNNETAFKLTLKCVRFWAIRRGLYNVNCGYFSGVTLAVMVAKVRQEFPDLQASCLLYKFFDRYAESGWREPVQVNFRTKA
jgi:poly(A) polymerase